MRSARIPVWVWIVFGVYYAISSYAMVYGIVSEYREYRLRKIGVDVEATITFIHPRARRVSGYIDYEFSYAGRMIKGSDFVSTVFQMKHPVGTNVRVRFLPDLPQFNHLAEQNSFQRLLWLSGLLVISAFPIAVTIAFLREWMARKRKARQMECLS